MEDFWTSTPFGITILASLGLTMLGGVGLAVRHMVRLWTGAPPSEQDSWPGLLVYLLGYTLVMLGVTYGAILVFYLAGLSMLFTHRSFGVTFGEQAWLVMQITVLCVWLGAAALIFRRMFRRWL